MAPPDITVALRELLQSFGPTGGGGDAAQACAKRLSKHAAVKEAMAPISKFLRWGSPELIAQRALELPADHPLQQAAHELFVTGGLGFTPWTSIASGPQPKRWVRRMTLASKDPLVWVEEDAPRISVWSLADGRHVTDLKIPGKSGTSVRHFTERDDGSLRVLASDGYVCERKPGAPAFVRIAEVGALKRENIGYDEGLDLLVRQVDFQPAEVDGQKVQRFELHDVARRAKREIAIPASYLSAQPVVHGRTAFISLNRWVKTGPGDEDEREEFFLAFVDMTTGAIETVELPGKADCLTVVGDGLALDLTDAAFNRTHHRLDLGARTLTPAVEPEDHGIVRVGEVTFDARRHAFIVDGERRGGYWIEGDPYNRLAIADPARGQLVLAGSDPAVPVVVIRPYDPKAERKAPPPPPAALAWARPGVVLTYELADFDAQDSWTFRVVEAAEELVLAVTMGESEEVASAMRFTAKALQSAGKAVAFAQGGADVDVEKPQDKVLPPICVSRSAYQKLAAGKELTWKSEWSDEGSLTATPAQATVRVDDQELPVATLAAAGDGVQLTILKDDRWPLVLDRTEGDCFVRLVSVNTTRTSAEVAARAAPGRSASAETTDPVPPAASSSGAAGQAVRRFELVEGMSSKFWEISHSGSAITVRFGKIGAAGQVSQKDLGSEAAALREAEKLIKEKTRKGYVERASPAGA